MSRIQILQGDCRELLTTLPEKSIHTCVTSPPYFGLRDYGVDGQIGLEGDVAAFVNELVGVFRLVHRVLRDDGTLWLNLGDSYAGSGRGGYAGGKSTLQGSTEGQDNSRSAREISNSQRKNCPTKHGDRMMGFKPKDLMMIPARVALALQADGWYLRQDIIWHKPNPMPESVEDRCTKAHEYIFLLSKSERYYFDSAAMKEPAVAPQGPGNRKPVKSARHTDAEHHRTAAGVHAIGPRETRNKRSVWTVTTRPFRGAHFATFPPDLIDPCVRAGAPINGTVLDPFNGAGTTGVVSLLNGRKYIGCELSPEYIALSERRLAKAREEVLW